MQGCRDVRKLFPGHGFRVGFPVFRVGFRVFRVGFPGVPGRVPVFRVGLRVLQIPIQARRANEICHVKTCHRKRTRL